MSITLDEMSGLARALLDAEQAVEHADAALSAAKESARILREETIPTAMQELGLAELKLSTGQKLKIKQEVYASIPKDGKRAAHEWLEKNGFGSLIKVDVVAVFGKGSQEQALDLFNEITGRGIDAEIEEGVNTSSLKALLREQIAAGKDVPLDLFGARAVFTTTIK